MGLREENPLIDSDLELIVETFEKAMIKSRDADSIFVGFARDLGSFRALPQSVITSIDSVPLPDEEDTTSFSPIPGITPVTTPETLVGASLETEEDGDDDDAMMEKVAEWVSECIPCDFRSLTEMDADFFSELGEGWEDMLNDLSAKLGDLENLLEDVDVVAPFCDLGDALKFQCPADLMKILFLLGMLLSRMELEVGADLGIFDSLLMSILAPIFNEMMANLDIIDDLALGPIRCIIDYIQREIGRLPEARQALQRAVTPPARLEAERARRESAESESARLAAAYEGGAEEMAERASREARETRERESRASDASSAAALDTVTTRLGQISDHTTLEHFQGFMRQGFQYLKDKKDYILGILQDLVDRGLDYFNNRVSFGRGKMDLLKYIAIIKAIVEAAESGDFSCGPDSESMTEAEIRILVDTYRHPSESLEVVLIDDTIIVRRNPALDDPDGMKPADEGPDAETEELSNIVVRRPISSCLGRVTKEEADQVQLWIRQLEQEG